MKNGKLIRAISFGLLLVFWGGLSAYMNDPQILPSPLAVFTEMRELWAAGKMQTHLAATAWRVLIAFILAMLIGTGLGYLMGRNLRLNAWLDPWLMVFINLPALIIIVLCLVWIGLNEVAAITAVTLNKVPLVTTIVREGARNASTELRDLAEIYHLSPYRRVRHIILPELYPSVMGAARSGLSVIWKIVLVVEFLGGSGGRGIGLQIHTRFSVFDVTGVIAYALGFVICVLLIELLVMQPLEKRARNWRGNAEA